MQLFRVDKKTNMKTCLKNKMIKITAALFISTLFSFGANAGNAAAAQYLVEENFAFISKCPEGKDFFLSGRDVSAEGSRLTSRYHTWFKIEDLNENAPVVLHRKIKSQSKGKLVFETRFNLIKEMEVRWQFREGEREAVVIAMQNGRIYLEGPEGKKTEIRSLPINRDCGLKIVFNLETRKIDIAIDGKSVASDAPFKNPVSAIDNFNLKTGEKSTGEMNLALVKIHNGYSLNERFLTTIGENLPEDWKVEKAGGTVSSVLMNSAIRPDVYSLKLDDTDASEAVSFSKVFPAESGKLVLEYKILIPQKTDGILLELFSGKNRIFGITTSKGAWQQLSASGKLSLLQDFTPNLWHHLKIKLDTVKGKADLWINEKSVVRQLDLASGGQPLTGIRFATDKAATGSFWLDDILLCDEVPYPEDYVPAPKPVNNSKTLVGIQNCSMWREGHHMGWDLIVPFPDRKPYLGFYDEGSPEVADWEIKWLSEHGVDFQIFCFFKPGNDKTPIKDPYMGYGLHDGFFNARYSDKLKFSILWENSGYLIKGNDDFRNHVIPFWIEYYFKDPRYQKIDGKPVLTIYRTDLLSKSIGTNSATVKEELDYLRAACQKAGFPGLVLLATSASSDKKTLADLKFMGFEGIYAYNWGTDGKSAEIQKAKMLFQQKAASGIIDMMPTLSHGMDNAPWFRTLGGFISAQELRDLTQWARETFMPLAPEGSLGRKTLILDNWNEWGEGHFFMPAAMEGFGYLKAVREFVGAPPSPEEVRPTPSQLSRINVLFPENRKGPVVPTRKKPPFSNLVQKAWNFDQDNDLEGWKVTQLVDNLAVSGGVISGRSTGRDPGMMIENLAIDISEVSVIRIKLKNNTSSDYGQFYFGTESDPALSETKATRFYIKPAEDRFLVYEVEMWRIPAWGGKLKSLRFDPADSEGDFSVDSIELLK